MATICIQASTYFSSTVRSECRKTKLLRLKENSVCPIYTTPRPLIISISLLTTNTFTSLRPPTHSHKPIAINISTFTSICTGKKAAVTTDNGKSRRATPITAQDDGCLHKWRMHYEDEKFVDNRPQLLEKKAFFYSIYILETRSSQQRQWCVRLANCAAP